MELINVPFCLPFINEDIEKEVYSCLNETGWLTTGPKVREFENEIAKLCNTKSVICVNSWTSGMLLLLKWLKLDMTDEVIVPVYTYAASALSVINSNIKCIYVDVNEDYTINIDCVRNAITKNTKAIMPVDLGGMPADYENLFNLVNSDYVRSIFNPKTDFQKKLGRPIIISDAAHSIGSTINKKPTPLFSDFSIFSFHSVKNITTGEGGAITYKKLSDIDDDKIINELRLLSLNGQSKSAFEKNSLGGWKYDIKTNGLKVNMPDINASIGLAQIKIYKDKLLPERELIFKKYNYFFKDCEWAITPKIHIGRRKSSCHLYQLRIKDFNEIKRDMLIDKLSNLNIGVNVHYLPLPMLSYFKEAGLNIKDFPSSYDLYKNEISLPIYNNLSIESVEYVCEKLIKIVNEINQNEH